MKNLFIIFAIFFSFHLSAQDNRITFNIETGYLSGIGEINYGNALVFKNSSSAVRLRVGSSYFISKRSSFGIVFGLDGYGNPVNNTAPLLFKAQHYFPFNNNKLLAISLGVGRSIKLSQEFEKGLYFSSSIGYVIRTKLGNWIPSFGYNLQQITDSGIIIMDIGNNTTRLINNPFYLNSLSFNLAFEF